MSELTPFGLTLRKLRLDKNLRLFDLAQLLDLSPAFLSAIETGRKPIPGGFVTKLSRAMELTAQEVNELGKAKDRTRREIKVDQNKEEDRELIASFARQIDGMPPEKRDAIKKLLSSLEGEHPFERRRRGLLVPPLSTREIRDRAERVRDAFVPPGEIEFPIIWVLEWGMLQVQPAFVFDVQEEDQMGDDEGRVPVGGNELIYGEMSTSAHARAWAAIGSRRAMNSVTTSCTAKYVWLAFEVTTTKFFEMPSGKRIPLLEHFSCHLVTRQSLQTRMKWPTRVWSAQGQPGTCG